MYGNDRSRSRSPVRRRLSDDRDRYDDYNDSSSNNGNGSRRQRRDRGSVSMIGTIRVMVAAATTMIGTGPLAEEAVAEEEADHSEGDAVAVGVVL